MGVRCGYFSPVRVVHEEHECSWLLEELYFYICIVYAGGEPPCPLYCCRDIVENVLLHSLTGSSHHHKKLTTVYYCAQHFSRTRIHAYSPQSTLAQRELLLLNLVARSTSVEPADTC